MKTAQDIADLYQARVSRLGPLHARMRDVRDTYNGDVVIPLPEISKHEQSTVANLTQQGLDQIARRVASVLPNLHYPPVRLGIQKSQDLADTRRKVNYGWWEQTNIRKVLARRARWFLGYAQAPVVIRPNPGLEIPTWEPCSPLDTFPAPVKLDGAEPDDLIIRHKKTLRWLRDNYPEQAEVVRKREDPDPDDEFEVLEYIDHDEVVFCVLGQPGASWSTPDESTVSVMLYRLPNRAGVCWGVNPQRVTLDRPVGQFDGILGMYQTQAALTAMEIIAARKTIFPDTWLVNPNTGQQPHIVQEPDYESGTPGIVVNGTIDRQQIPPNFSAGQLAQRLEGAQRDTAGLPPELGGMSQSNVRTARRGSQVLGASIDFTIAEAQDAFAESLHAENVRAIAIDKAYFNTSKSFYVSQKGSSGDVEYKPSAAFENDRHVVSYPLAGTDLSDLVINGGQRVGMGTMSKRSFMEIDPIVNDADAEEQRIKFESMEQAFFAAVQQEAAVPEGPWQAPDLARLAKLMFTDELPWYQAVEKLQAEKQKEQAAGAPAGAPETMPGLAMPGQGAEVPAIEEPTASMGNLTQMLSQLGTADMAMKSR